MPPSEPVGHIERLVGFGEKERTAPALRPVPRQGGSIVSTNPAPTGTPLPRHTEDELLTLQEVANVVRVPVATLRYWRHVGTGLRSFRIGRSVRYWRTEVYTWLDSQSAVSQADCQDTSRDVGRTRNG